MRLLHTLAHEIITNHGPDIDWAPEYAEPGYQAGDTGIYFANWNTRSTYDAEGNRTECPTIESRLAPVLEHLGASIEWSDEWATCGDCNRAVRTQPDCYSWLPSFVLMNDCEIVCEECCDDDPEVYIEHLANNPDRADTFQFDFEAHGFTQAPTGRHDEYQTGFHPGQNDDPHKVFAALAETGRQVCFQIVGKGQFDCHWIAWTRDLTEEDE